MTHHIFEAFQNGDMSGLAAAAAGALGAGAWNALEEMLDVGGKIKDEILDTLRGAGENLLDQIGWPSSLSEALEHVKELADAVAKEGETVFKDIADRVGDALDTGEITPHGDGGLGETHDNYTPDGEVPFDVGELPGYGGSGAGTNRDAGGPSPPSYDGGGGGGSVGGTVPLGGGSAPGGATPGGTGASDTAPDDGPTYEDLGLDPESGVYFEYHPSEGEVVIQYPDGTTENRPWP